MVNATRQAFQSVFSLMSNNYLRQAIDPTQAPSIPATVSNVITRLFVYEAFEYVIVSLMIVGTFIIIAVALYNHRHPSILHEGHKGLLGYAAIAQRSDLGELIDYAAKWPHPDTPESSNRASSSLSQPSKARDGRQSNGNGADTDRRKSHITGGKAWNREIMKTIKDEKILEEPRWRGKWKVQHWGEENEWLIREKSGDCEA